MPNPTERPIPPLIHYITLNINISTLKQISKNLVGNLGGIYVRIMHAKFQASSLPHVGGEWGGRWTDTWRQAFLNR